MSFLSPLFLLGIAAVAIPFLLFRLRTRPPKELPFSTLAFLERLQKEALRTFRLRQWLLLLIRAGIMALLALAAARPFLAPAAQESPFKAGMDRAILGILLDNSPSMGRQGADGSILDAAVREWSAALLRLPRETGILLQKTSGRPLPERLLTTGEAIEELQKIAVEPTADMSVPRLLELNRQLRLYTEEQQAAGSIWLTTDDQRPVGELPEAGAERVPDVPVMVVRVAPGQVASGVVTPGQVKPAREPGRDPGQERGQIPVSSAETPQQTAEVKWNLSVSRVDLQKDADSDLNLGVELHITPLFQDSAATWRQAELRPTTYLTLVQGEQILTQVEIPPGLFRPSPDPGSDGMFITDLQIPIPIPATSTPAPPGSSSTAASTPAPSGSSSTTASTPASAEGTPRISEPRLRILLEGDDFVFDNQWFGIVAEGAKAGPFVHIRGEDADTEAYLSILLTEIRSVPFESWTMEQAGQRLGGLASGGVVVMEALPAIPAWFRTQVLQWVREGGTLWYVPALNADPDDLSAFLAGLGGVSMRSPMGSPGSARPIDRISLSHRSEEFLKGVFRGGDREPLPDPLLQYMHPFLVSQALRPSTLMKTASGEPLLQEFPFGRGRVVLSSIGFTSAWSELPLQPVFVPLMLNLIGEGGERGPLRASAASVGGWNLIQSELRAPLLQRFDVPIGLGGEDAEWTLVGGERSQRPTVTMLRDGIELRVAQPVFESGFLQAVREASQASKVASEASSQEASQASSEKHLLAVNLPGEESVFTPVEPEVWRVRLADQFTHVGILEAGDGSLALRLPGIVRGEGMQMWHWMLLFAFFLLILESIIANRLSLHQTTETS